MIFTKASRKLNRNKITNLTLICTFIVTISPLIFTSCSDDDQNRIAEYPEIIVNLGTHKLMAYTVAKNSKYLIVFESGHGNDHTSWYSTGKSSEILSIADFLDSDVLLYDRAGYGKSEFNSEPRDINKLTSELEKVVDQFAKGRKVVLVGHSLGGFIIRDYAIKNPAKVAGLLFVDSSHEKKNHLSQEELSTFYNNYKITYGENSGIALETLQLIEDFNYMKGLPNLPDVPTIVLTSMKIDVQNDAVSKQQWYDAHESLKVGVTDFTHITTVNSGHFIQLDEPKLVLENIKLLLLK